MYFYLVHECGRLRVRSHRSCDNVDAKRRRLHQQADVLLVQDRQGVG